MLASRVPNSFETCGPSIPPMMGPSGPPTSTVWLIFVFAPAGSIRQLKRNFVPGTTLVTRAKPRPGCTSTSCMLWFWPAFVFITPVDPETKPPFQSMVETLGFHSPQVDISDQICQTLSGDAVDSTEVPYSRAIPLPPSALGELERARSRDLGDPFLRQVEKDDDSDQKRGADQLDAVDRLVEAPGWRGRGDERRRDRVGHLRDRGQRRGRPGKSAA